MDPRQTINAPTIARVPIWGPDRYSLRTALRGLLRGNPVVSARTGVGVRPAPIGASQSEGVKWSGVFPVRQQIVGANLAYLADPSVKNVPVVAQFPTTQAAVNPILVQLSSRVDRGRWT